jgi:hypothetical protein
MILPSELSARAIETPPAAGDAAADSVGASEAGASNASVVGAATDGAVVAAPPPLEQAATIAAIATAEGISKDRRTSSDIW